MALMRQQASLLGRRKRGIPLIAGSAQIGARLESTTRHPGASPTPVRWRACCLAHSARTWSTSTTATWLSSG
ncbi:MAG: hypothetical protein JO023_15895 [Chloroflexi bacterium]|nr:hypothetical protein [Chloroflexota bacterium]